MNLKIKDILEVTKGKLIIGDVNYECENFCRDTRKIKNKDTYIGIKGATFDGNVFWKEALQNGADVVILENVDFQNENLSLYKDKNIILVDNTLKALKQIATAKRELYKDNLLVIGITGSVGKTSTKDIIANVMSQKFNTLKTEGNNNNDIGLPFTILNLRNHEVAVIEMGMNHPGEIEELTKIAKPHISVITNIGTSHIGNLGSRENILKAKLEILEGMKNKVLVINNDNDMLHKLTKESKGIEIHTYGIENYSQVNAKNIILNEQDSNFECEIDNENIKITVPVGGIHFIYNAMCATLIGKMLGLNNNEIKKGIESFKLTKKRMDITELKNGIKIINDSYNASFESMQASLKYLSGFKENRKIAVLGDMFELGEYSEKLHRSVGKEVAKNKIDILICNGENSRYIAEEAKLSGMNEKNIIYLEKEKIVEYINKNFKKGDIILFKASNGMKFYHLVEELKKEN